MEHVGNHTLRRHLGTGLEDHEGYYVLYYSHPSVTLRYIGITEEETNNVLKSFSVFH